MSAVLRRAVVATFLLAGLTALLPARHEEPSGKGTYANVHVGLVFDVGGRVYHASGTTGHGVFEAARDMGAFGIGVDSDQHDEMPGTVITSMIKRGDVAVFDTILAVAKGELQGGLRSFGIAEQGVGYVSEGPHATAIPASVKARVAELAQKIARGEIRVPSQ